MELNPELDPQTLAPGQKIRLERVKRRAARSRRSRGGAARRACPRTRRAHAPARTRSSAPQAIVIEVSTGIVACQRQADKRRAIGSTTKLMTALLTLEKAKLERHLHGRELQRVAGRVPDRPPAAASG